jgi:integrase/recombinase XerD
VSASTLEAYTVDLALLSRWAAGPERDLLDLSAADLTRYVAERAGQGTQYSTLARHLSSFRRFYEFLVGQGVVALNPATVVSVPQALRNRSTGVGDDVVRALLKPPPEPFATPVSAFRARRDHAIVCMLYGTGLGISDVRLLREEQVDTDRSVVRVPFRSGALRSFALDPTLLAALAALHQARALAGSDLAESNYCFPTSSGLPMTRQALCHAVRKWALERGQAGAVTPSALRQAGLARHFRRRPVQRPVPQSPALA